MDGQGAPEGIEEDVPARLARRLPEDARLGREAAAHARENREAVPEDSVVLDEDLHGRETLLRVVADLEGAGASEVPPEHVAVGLDDDLASCGRHRERERVRRNRREKPRGQREERGQGAPAEAETHVRQW